MPHQQLKEPAKDRADLARGVEIVPTKLPALDSGDLGGDWAGLLIAHIPMREPKQLIETGLKTSEEDK